MQELEDKLLQIWERRHHLIVQRLESIEKAAQSLDATNKDAHLRQLACTEAHRLAGSLGALGLDEGSSLAEEAEGLLRGCEAIPAHSILRLQQVCGALRNIVLHGPTPLQRP
jgi:HPt (histidine-containing phosphotransfer) domain-containing protein